MPSPQDAAAPTPPGLNPQQRAAVDHAAGPLAVLAGPGTGKTRVIVERVARIVESGTTPPDRILAVTFTNKAAEQLRARLAERLGAAAADALHIHTFHALGSRIIARFPDRFGFPSLPRHADTAERRRALRAILINHNLLLADTAAGLDSAVDLALRYTEAFANAAVSPRAAADFARAQLAALDAKGTPATPSAESVTELARRHELARLLDAARAADLFEAHCRDRALFTYATLAELPVRALGSDPLVTAVLRAQYRAAVVDEWQDVNLVQIRLLERLFPPATNPDLCVVGDDDQAIYGFRGSDDRAFTRFAERWTNHTTVELTANYRSAPCILAAANHTIARATARFRPNKATTAEGPPRPEASVRAVALNKEDGHTAFDLIADMILADRAQTPSTPWRSFAILVRSNTHADQALDALRLRRIPTSSRRNRPVREDPVLLDLLAWARLLADPADATSARRLLSRAPFRLPTDFISAWQRRHAAILARARGTDPAAPATPHAPETNFVTLLRSVAADLPADSAQEIVPPLTRFLDLYDRLAAVAAHESAENTLAEIIRAADLLHADLPIGDLRAHRLATLVSAIAFVRERAPRLDEPRDIAAFVRYYNDLSPNEQNFTNETAADEPDLDADADAVTVLTAHTAKGLEFDTVFVPGVNPAKGCYPMPNSREAIELPAELTGVTPDPRTAADRAADEERRVFYVACTRAERRLVLFAQWNKNPSTARQHFFEELTRRDDAPRSAVALLQSADVAKAARAAMGPDAQPTSPLDRASPPSRDAARAHALDRAKADARHAAALALELAANAGAQPPAAATPPEALTHAATRLHSAASTLLAIAAVEQTGTPPAWLASVSPAAHTAAQALAGKLRELAAPPLPETLEPLAPPLELSYTFIRDYETCARCLYLKRVHGLPDAPGDALTLGSVVHTALQKFYERVREAGSTGQPLPTLTDLLAHGDAAIRAAALPESPVTPAFRAQVRAQLTLAFDRLHNPADHVLELEHRLVFPWLHNGRRHTFTAKLDRLDQNPDGTVRIIDYKTGRASNALREPPKDDLQMALYTLALRADRNDPDLQGTAEYWLLSSGERGQIPLSALDLAKATARVNTVIDGVLAGLWPRAKRCESLCRITE
jgi:superfamily I DNA/RNA helicase/RecB family exonuclease